MTRHLIAPHDVPPAEPPPEQVEDLETAPAAAPPAPVWASPWASLAGVVVLVATAGVVHGTWTNRWGANAELKEAVARMQAIPREAAGWRGVDRQLSESQVRGNAGAFYHRYEQAATGRGVEVFMLCDRPGVVATHTPDVCYTASGFTVGEKRRFRLETAAGPEEFVTAVFKKEAGGQPVYLRIFWAWTSAGAWAAPDEPRLAFATAKVLYKMYVIQELATPDEPYENGPAAALMQSLLPGMRAALFPPGLPPRAARPAPANAL